MPNLTRLALATGAVALSFTVAACAAGSTTGADRPPRPTAHGSASPSAEPSTATADAKHNDSDVIFAQNMIVHHRSAVEMARMVATQGSDQRVKDLASRIEAAQTPEIIAMTGWLTAWGEPLDAGQVMPGMNDSATPMDMPGPMGMMTGQQMKTLTAAHGPAFDRMFLRLMTSHHQGAIDMSEAEQAGGISPQAIALAESIRTSQTAEISEMKQMLQA